EALEIGLITRVVSDDAVLDEGRALARDLAEGPTRALAATKRLLWDGLGSTVEARLPDESRTVSELSGTADAREGLAAVLEERRRNFPGGWAPPPPPGPPRPPPPQPPPATTAAPTSAPTPGRLAGRRAL